MPVGSTNNANHVVGGTRYITIPARQFYNDIDRLNAANQHFDVLRDKLEKQQAMIISRVEALERDMNKRLATAPRISETVLFSDWLCKHDLPSLKAQIIDCGPNPAGLALLCAAKVLVLSFIISRYSLRCVRDQGSSLLNRVSHSLIK